FEIDVPNLPAGWSITVYPQPTMLLKDGGGQVIISLQVKVPANTAPGTKELTVRATALSAGSPARALMSNTAKLTVKLIEPPTGDIRGTGCPDDPAPGTDFDNARLLRVDAEERHGICSTGEEDWFKFGAVAGKYYTIDITQNDTGLDLALDLFDDQ